MKTLRAFPTIYHSVNCSGDIPEPRIGASMVADAVKRCFYLFGGRVLSTRELTNDLYQFDTLTGHWSKMSEVQGIPPEPRSHHAAGTVRDVLDYNQATLSQILIIGGCGESSLGDGNHARLLDSAHLLDLRANPPRWIPVAATGQHPPPGYGHQVMSVSDSSTAEPTTIIGHRLVYPPRQTLRVIFGYGLNRRVSGKVYDLNLESLHWSCLDYETPDHPITSTYDVILSDPSWLYGLVQHPQRMELAITAGAQLSGEGTVSYGSSLRKRHLLCMGMGRTYVDEISIRKFGYLKIDELDLQLLLWTTVSLVARYQLLLSSMSKVGWSGVVEDGRWTFGVFGKQTVNFDVGESWPVVSFACVKLGSVEPRNPMEIGMTHGTPEELSQAVDRGTKPPEDAPIQEREEWMQTKMNGLGRLVLTLSKYEWADSPAVLKGGAIYRAVYEDGGRRCVKVFPSISGYEKESRLYMQTSDPRGSHAEFKQLVFWNVHYRPNEFRSHALFDRRYVVCDDWKWGLKDYILQKGETPNPLEFESIIKDISVGLAMLWTCGIVHTRLDPDIIFGVINRRGEMVWKIGDLQYACQRNECVEYAPGVHCAPEIIRGVRRGCPIEARPSMDAFSLGQVIHILSRGELVQEGDLSEEQYLHQLEDDAEFAIDPADHHSDDIADLIQCMVQKDPRERLRSLKKLTLGLRASGASSGPTTDAFSKHIKGAFIPSLEKYDSQFRGSLWSRSLRRVKAPLLSQDRTLV